MIGELHRWLDPQEDGTFIVHDWPDHANDSVHAKLYREVRLFADGTKPLPKKIGVLEKEKLHESWVQLSSAAAVGSQRLPIGEKRQPALALTYALTHAIANADGGQPAAAAPESPPLETVDESEFSGVTPDQRRDDPPDPLTSFPEAIRPKARELFAKYWFWHKGCLPNLERSDVKEGLVKVAGVIQAFPLRAEPEVAAFIEKPPEGFPRGSTYLWHIFAYLGLDPGKPDKSKPRPTANPAALVAEAKRRLEALRKEGYDDKEFLTRYPDIPQAVKLQAIAEMKRTA
jgi:hypothetical protein